MSSLMNLRLVAFGSLLYSPKSRQSQGFVYFLKENRFAAVFSSVRGA
jgi:hypothetical protein